MSDKPFSPAAERNKQVILEHLRPLIYKPMDCLEIGSGTGQHVLHFAKALPQTQWQSSNYPDILEQTQAGLVDCELPNVRSPIALDVTCHVWPDKHYDLIYSANTCHIMPWDSVCDFVMGSAVSLKNKGLLCIYGPFNYAGHYTSQSNRDFDARLKMNNPLQGIRDIENIIKLAQDNKLSLVQDFALPANNRFLVFRSNSSDQIDSA